MIRPILRLGDPLLQAPAQPVADITPEIERLIDDMVETMYAAPASAWRRRRWASRCASSSSICRSVAIATAWS